MRKFLAFSALASCLFMVASFARAACQSSDCSTMGYVKSLSDCSGKTYIKCPFDTSKVFCSDAVAPEPEPEPDPTPTPAEICQNKGFTLHGGTCKDSYADPCPEDPTYYACKCQGYQNRPDPSTGEVTLTSCASGYVKEACPESAAYFNCINPCPSGYSPGYVVCPSGQCLKSHTSQSECGQCVSTGVTTSQKYRYTENEAKTACAGQGAMYTFIAGTRPTDACGRILYRCGGYDRVPEVGETKILIPSKSCTSTLGYATETIAAKTCAQGTRTLCLMTSGTKRYGCCSPSDYGTSILMVECKQLISK